MNRRIIEAMLGITRPSYAWRIDTWPPVDGAGPLEPDGTVIEGPHDADTRLLERLARHEGQRFRLSDDDGNLYCEGWFLPGTGDDPDGELQFMPLWDYGQGGLGAVSIAYLEPTGDGSQDTWHTL